MTTSGEFDRFLRQVAALLNIQWRRYRRRQSRRGLVDRLRARGVRSLESYRRILEEDAEERERLVAAMRVTVSRFRREGAVWDELIEQVVPGLVSLTPPDGVVAAWCAGCSCGEEPYTLAMLWDGLGEDGRGGRRLEILATDIDEDALERAKSGVYGRSSLRELPWPLRDRYFEPVGDRFRLVDTLRDGITFSSADLLRDQPPAERHLVLCRYLAFTYYRGPRRSHALDALGGALFPGGALMIGRRESLPPEADLALEPWPNTQSVYRRR